MIRDEGSLLLRSVLWGIGLAALYDVLRILRGVIRHRQGVRSLEDLAYWCFTACSLFWLLFSGNNGTVRWYILAGVGAGAWLYHPAFQMAAGADPENPDISGKKGASSLEKRRENP